MKNLSLLSIGLAVSLSSRGDSLVAGAIGAGAARLNNGSVVLIGQPLVGFTGTASGSSVHFGLLPLSSSSTQGPVSSVTISLEDVSFSLGSFSVRISTEPGRLYTLEASTDLAVWSPVGSQRATDRVLNLTDAPGGPRMEYRFYRISIGP